PLDGAGAVLGALALTACALALVQSGRQGVLAPWTLAAAAATAVLVALFVRAERRHPDPMLPLSLFRDRRFSTANAMALVMNLTGIGSIFLFSLFLQGVQGRGPLETGAAMLALFVPVIGLAPLAGRLTAAYGPRGPATAGLLLDAAGAALLLTVGASSSYGALLPSLLLIGAGTGVMTTPVVHTAVGAVPEDRAALAGGVNNAARQTGGAIGVALLGAPPGPERPRLKSSHPRISVAP
ncbi:MFS transporter, partial [Streptomyces montanisoli]